MDLILLIIAICFRVSGKNHNYMALEILSIIGGLLCILLAFTFSPLAWIDVVLYAIVLVVCLTATNKEEDNM